MANRLTRPEKRLYPWRASLDQIACTGLFDPPDLGHLGVPLRALVQRDPASAPYEWTCPICEVAKPSVMWDTTVPVPPHEFVQGPNNCRVCWQPESDRGWHPEPIKPVFDPATVALLEPVMTQGGWSIVLDDTLGYMEAYCSQSQARVACSTETWRTMSMTDEAWERFTDDTMWLDIGTGMRWLAGVPEFEVAARLYAESSGQGVVQAKDEITQLYELARSLTLQAASIGANGTDEQRQVLTGRYLQARGAFRALQARIERLETELDTAALSVINSG